MCTEKTAEELTVSIVWMNWSSSKSLYSASLLSCLFFFIHIQTKPSHLTFYVCSPRTNIPYLDHLYDDATLQCIRALETVWTTDIRVLRCEQ